MRGSEFSELRAFVAVADRRNFGRAAAHLGLVPSTISQMVRTLEERLGVRLLNRTTRNVSLTDAGEQLLVRARPAIMELEAAVGDLNDFRDIPTGTLRLNVSSGAAQIVLAPAMKAFLDAYPAIALDITINDEESDIVGGRFDAGMRIGRLVARDMQMVPVSTPMRAIAFASPAYLAQHPAPTVPLDLQRHNCIGLRRDNQVMAWEFQKGKDKVDISIGGTVVVNSIELLVRAALDGIGIAYSLEAYIVDHIAAGRLVPLLADWSAVQHSYYLYYSGKGHVPVPLQRLIEFFRLRAQAS